MASAALVPEGKRQRAQLAQTLKAVTQNGSVRSRCLAVPPLAGKQFTKCVACLGTSSQLPVPGTAVAAVTR